MIKLYYNFNVRCENRDTILTVDKNGVELDELDS